MPNLYTIREYLVGLKWEIDQNSLDAAQHKLRDFERTVEHYSHGWIKTFIQAGALLTGTLTSLAGASYGLLSHFEKHSIAMTQFANSMLLPVQTARKLKDSLDLMGVSFQQAIMSPILMQRLQKLMGSNLTGWRPEGWDKTLSHIHDMTTSVSELEGSFENFLRRIASELDKNGTIKEFTDLFKSLRETLDSDAKKGKDSWAVWIGDRLKDDLDMLKQLYQYVRSFFKEIDYFQTKHPLGFAEILGSVGAIVAFQNPVLGLAAAMGGLLYLLQDYHKWEIGEASNKTLAPFWKWWKTTDFHEKLKAIKILFSAFTEDLIDDIKAFVQKIPALLGDGAWAINFGLRIGRAIGDGILTGLYDVLPKTIREGISGLSSAAKTAKKELDRLSGLQEVAPGVYAPRPSGSNPDEDPVFHKTPKAPWFVASPPGKKGESHLEKAWKQIFGHYKDTTNDTCPLPWADSWNGPSSEGEIQFPKKGRGEHVSGQDIVSYLVGKGVSPKNAAAIAGNFLYESGGWTGAIGDNGSSVGLAQWHNGRGEALLAYAKQHHENVLDYKTQLDFAMQENQFDTSLKQMKTGSAELRAAQFESTYEKPANFWSSAIERSRLAEKYYEEYQQHHKISLEKSKEFWNNTTHRSSSANSTYHDNSTQHVTVHVHGVHDPKKTAEEVKKALEEQAKKKRKDEALHLRQWAPVFA